MRSITQLCGSCVEVSQHLLRQRSPSSKCKPIGRCNVTERLTTVSTLARKTDRGHRSKPMMSSSNPFPRRIRIDVSPSSLRTAVDFVPLRAAANNLCNSSLTRDFYCADTPRSLDKKQIHSNMRAAFSILLVFGIAVTLLSLASKAAPVRSFSLAQTL